VPDVSLAAEVLTVRVFNSALLSVLFAERAGKLEVQKVGADEPKLHSPPNACRLIKSATLTGSCLWSIRLTGTVRNRLVVGTRLARL
jgi:hypothetical protein